MNPTVDPVFQGLFTALDTDASQELFRNALPELVDDLELVRSDILNVKYEPGTRCVIHYRLEVRDRRSGRTADQAVSVRVLHAGESPIEMTPRLPGSNQSSGFGHHNCETGLLRTPFAALLDQRMIVYAFPIDPLMPGLVDALDRRAVRRALRRVWPRLEKRVQKVAICPLAYTPHARASLLYELFTEGEDEGQLPGSMLVGKMRAQTDPARLFGDAHAMWRAAESRVGLARPVGFITPFGLTLQEHVRGESLADLVTSPSLIDTMHRTACIVANFHGLSAPLTSRRSGKREARLVHRMVDTLAAVHPDLAHRLERLRGALVSELEDRTTVTGPVHGDLHSSNVLVDGNSISLIDLDNLGYGDPASDVGRFLASLRTRALRQFGDRGALADAGEAFLAQYLVHDLTDEASVRLFEAARLLHVANYLFEIQRRGWKEEVEDIVDEVGHVLEKARAGRRVPVGHRVIELLEPFESRVNWAKDPVYMRAVLAPYVGEAYARDIEACRASSKLNDGACQVRYSLKCRNGDARSRLVLDGYLWRDHDGRSKWSRLEALTQALDGRRDLPLFPRVVGYFSPLSILFVENAHGTRFSSALHGSGGPDAAAKVAKAFAAFHKAPIDIHKYRALEIQFQALAQWVDRLRANRPELYERARMLQTEVDQTGRAVQMHVGPVIKNMRLSQIILVDGRVAVTGINEVVMAPILVDVGNQIARLTLMDTEAGGKSDAPAVVSRFRESYMLASAISREEIAPFESMALLRAACVRAALGNANGTDEALLFAEAVMCTARSGPRTSVTGLAGVGGKQYPKPSSSSQES